MQQQERLWHLLALHLSGEASAEELEELQTLTDNTPEFKIQVNILIELWQTKTPEDINELKSAWEKHQQRMT